MFYGSDRVGGSWAGRGMQAEAERLLNSAKTEEIKLGSGRTSNALPSTNT